jgi:hypothetical protein
MRYVTHSVHPGVWHGNCSACAVTVSVDYEAVSLAVLPPGTYAGLRQADEAFF